MKPNLPMVRGRIQRNPGRGGVEPQKWDKKSLSNMGNVEVRVSLKGKRSGTRTNCGEKLWASGVGGGSPMRQWSPTKGDENRGELPIKRKKCQGASEADASDI